MNKTRLTGEIVDKANFDAWQTWIPTVTGFTAAPTVTAARCCLIGKLCTVHFRMSAGTSNSVLFTISLLYAAANTTIQTAFGIAAEGGTTQTAVARIDTRVNSNIVDVYKTAALGAWTSGLGRLVNFSMTYEIA